MASPLANQENDAGAVTRSSALRVRNQMLSGQTELRPLLISPHPPFLISSREFEGTKDEGLE